MSAMDTFWSHEGPLEKNPQNKSTLALGFYLNDKINLIFCFQKVSREKEMYQSGGATYKQDKEEGLNANQKSDIPHGDKIPYSLFAPREHMSQSRLSRSFRKHYF